MASFNDEYHRLRQLEADAEHNRDELRARADRADDIARAARVGLQAVRRRAWAERVTLTVRDTKTRPLGRLVALAKGVGQTDTPPELMDCPHCGDEIAVGLAHCPECSTELDAGEDGA